MKFTILEAKYKSQVLNWKTCEKPLKTFKCEENQCENWKKRNILPLCVWNEWSPPMWATKQLTCYICCVNGVVHSFDGTDSHRKMIWTLWKNEQNVNSINSNGPKCSNERARPKHSEEWKNWSENNSSNKQKKKKLMKDNCGQSYRWQWMVNRQWHTQQNETVSVEKFVEAPNW